MSPDQRKIQGPNNLAPHILQLPKVCGCPNYGSPNYGHDSRLFKPLLTGNEKAVYADSVYRSVEHDRLLAGRGITNNITHRAYRNTPLTAAQKAFNRRHNGTRSIVERVFGVLKLHYDMGKARYLGRSRNQTRVDIMSIAYNLKRAAAIQKKCLEYQGISPCHGMTKQAKKTSNAS